MVMEIKEYDVRAHRHGIVVKIVKGGLCSFLFSLFIFLFFFFYSLFLFLEQLRLGVISHKTDHETWENEVEGTRIK